MAVRASDHVIELHPKRLAALEHEPKKVARAAQLRYVHDDQPGITRKGAGKGWSYSLNNKLIKDRAIIDRINALAIPPAWTDVWICAHDNGHLQATGLDVKGRKQYRYHKRWAEVRGQVKYHRLHTFGKHLPRLRKQVHKDLDLKGMPKEKVLAGAVALMERTRIRVGNKAYEQSNGSFGLSTLKNKHVKREKKGLRIRFKGKSGIIHDIPLQGARLSRLVMRCKELPGQDLFTYVDDEGEAHDVDSGMVNEYIRTASGGDFSSKDLRTWMGSARCVDTLLDVEQPGSATECTRCVNEAMDEVAQHLGNTRAVCKAHYVHPGVVRAFEEGKLSDLAKGVHKATPGSTGLGKAERVLMKIIADRIKS